MDLRGYHRRGGHGARDPAGELADGALAVELAGLLPKILSMSSAPAVSTGRSSRRYTTSVVRELE